MMSLVQILSAFCQMALLLLFAFTAWRKGRDLAAFAHSLEGFAIVPPAWVDSVARLTTFAEALVTLLLVFGFVWQGVLLAGFTLALLLLLLFTGALVSVVARDLSVPCSCFGASERPVSRIALVRNAGLIVCSATGLFAALVGAEVPLALWAARLSLFLMAATFVVLWAHLDEMIAVGRSRTSL
jgi:hypothetical protein